MAERKNIRLYNDNDKYIYGNTVRKLQPAPAERPGAQPQAPKKVSRKTRRNRERVLQMNLGYVAFLTVIAVAAVFVCVKYLNIQSDITRISKNISSLESELDTLRSENDIVYNSIVDSVDLEYVRQVAMQELGMVAASADRVITYKNQNDDYVKQYEEIPEDGVVE